MTFSVAGGIALAADLPVVARPLTLSGPGRSLLTIDGGGLYRLLAFDNASLTPLQATVSGLTLARGKAALGGGLNAGNESVAVSGVEFAGNAATVGGGGAYVRVGGGLALTDCAFRGNGAPTGGACSTRGAG